MLPLIILTKGNHPKVYIQPTWAIPIMKIFSFPVGYLQMFAKKVSNYGLRIFHTEWLSFGNKIGLCKEYCENQQT